ncbi:hypothetical protein F2P81_017250 [Scophthalmus maximus]|uniref:Uncharacterized protein n=1 Tax=Scophthalmus maximus TaxID=52904 RepID=A0A6A4SD42_SCOMX|nr:hypothetical protein F2P81_017250 [Scophthalmus maximus]
MTFSGLFHSQSDTQLRGRDIFNKKGNKCSVPTGKCFVFRLDHRLFMLFVQHFPAVSGAFMDSPYNGNTSLQTSTSNLNAGYRPSEAEDDGKVSSDTIWLWVAVLATIGNIVVVAVVCACAF